MKMVYLLLLGLLAGPISAGANPTVLLTAFEPFDGRKENGSQNVAREIERRYAEDGINYKICILPVEYDGGAEAAEKCYEEMKTKPDLVLSTGEGGCDVRAESRAHNLDDTPGLADNAGVERVNHVIEAGAPEHEPLGLPVPEMVCAAPRKGDPPVVPSVSPGYYVCNATAYRLARYFNPKHIPFGFVHLPTASCAVKAADTARLLHGMVKEAWRVLAPPASGDCVDCRKREPVNKKALDKLACESSVREELARKLRRWSELHRQRGDIVSHPTGGIGRPTPRPKK